MSAERLITLTSDFGYEDVFVGVMKGVMLGINPDARLVDLTHGIRPYDVREAAIAIGANYHFFPTGSIHLVVVDPGVGSARRPIAVGVNGHYFVGPDNGVFSSVYQSASEEPHVVHITSDKYVLESKSPTFQGRDVFAPVAAWLSTGLELSSFGERTTDYQKIEIPLPEKTVEGRLRGEVIHIDRFGNAISNITRSDISGIFTAKSGVAVRISLKEKEVPLKECYSQGGVNELCALFNSSGFLEFFVNRGSASGQYLLSLGDPAEIAPADLRS